MLNLSSYKNLLFQIGVFGISGYNSKTFGFYMVKLNQTKTFVWSGQILSD